MKVVLQNGSTYGRLTAFDFGNTEIEEYRNHYDYIFFASTSDFPDQNLQVIKKTSAIIKVIEIEEEQIATYHPTCRNEIRRSYRTPEFSVEVNSTPLNELFLFHSACEKERGWKPVPPEELDQSITICVRYNSELIAGMTAYKERDFLRVGRIFSRRKSELYKELPQVIFSSASRRVVHEMTRWCKNNNIDVLDLGGVDLEDPSKIGISKFKMSFGSSITPMYLGRVYGNNYLALEKYISENNYDLT